MKKTLKLATAFVLTASAVTMSTVSAQAYNEDVARLQTGWVQRSAGEVTEAVNQALAVSNEYTIQWGDTLATIAKAIGLSVEEVMALNQIENPDLIFAGTKLSFDRENHQITFMNEDTNEEVTYSTETGEEVDPIVEDGVLIASVDEWIDPEAIETDVEAVEEEVYAEEIVEEVVAEETIVEEPAVAAAAASFEPAQVEWPEIEEPVIAEAPVYEEPIVEEPVYEEVVQEDSSLTVNPGGESWEAVEVEEPVYEEPVYEEPVVEEPVVEAPQGPMDATTAFSVITSEKGLSQAEIDGWSMIISRESGWNPTIANPSSGAYGLPQALPGNKMASHGADWATNPYTQLAWMYDYMVGRYGSIQDAVNFWNANHWY